MPLVVDTRCARAGGPTLRPSWTIGHKTRWCWPDEMCCLFGTFAHWPKIVPETNPNRMKTRWPCVWLHGKPKFSTQHFIGLCVCWIVSGEMPCLPHDFELVPTHSRMRSNCVGWLVLGRDSGNRAGVGSNTWPQISALLCNRAGDGGALHFTLVIDNYTRIVLKIDEHPVSPSERFSLPNHNSRHNLDHMTNANKFHG